MCSWTGREKFQVNTNGELLLRKIESDEGGCAARGFSERGKEVGVWNHQGTHRTMGRMTATG